MAVRKCKKKQTKQRLDEPKKANLALGDRLHFSSQKIIKRSQCLVFRIWRITSSSFSSLPERTQWKGPWSRFSQYCGLRCTTYTGKNSDVFHLKKLISVLSWLRDVNILLSSFSFPKAFISAMMFYVANIYPAVHIYPISYPFKEKRRQFIVGRNICKS